MIAVTKFGGFVKDSIESFFFLRHTMAKAGLTQILWIKKIFPSLPSHSIKIFMFIHGTSMENNWWIMKMMTGIKQQLTFIFTRERHFFQFFLKATTSLWCWNRKKFPHSIIMQIFVLFFNSRQTFCSCVWGNCCCCCCCFHVTLTSQSSFLNTH